MTKEKLYEKMHKVLRPVTRDTELATDILDKFFESNVCIPKGANRHPYADVLHEWIEGADMQVPTKDVWYTMANISESFLDKEYRIKPSEPVWEYQFVYIKADNTAELTQFYTDEEAKDCHQWIKLKETKRERK